MRKKFLSTLLMGALVTASMSTFTSCKDYDDDINNLQTQIDGLRKSLDEIKKLIESGSVITSVAPINNGVKVTMSNGKTFEITNGKDGKDGANGTVWTINDQGYWVKDGVVTEYKALGKDGAKGDKGDKGEAGPKGDKGDKGEAGKYYVPNAQTGKFDLVENGKTTPTEISFLAPGTITAVKDADFLKLFNVKGAESDPVVISLTNSLKSLVFVPDFYYGGIEAFDFNTFTFKALTVAKVDADGDFATDKPTVGDEVVSSPDLAATYHLNPTNAKMSDEVAKYKFVAFNKDYTRASADVSSAFTMKSVDLKTKAGYATVHAAYNGKVIKSIANDKQVTVLALQYTDDDATVTSDYAAVRANTYKNLVLNNPKYAPQADAVPSWLYKTAKDAIDNTETVKLAWNNDKGIDLREYVNTRYQFVKADGNPGEYSNWDENAAAGVVEKSGYKYTFELVGWHDGVNKTSASAHAAIAEDGFTLRAQMPKEGKQQAYAFNKDKANNEQNQATIDREPLVRVILTDDVNKKIAAVGYIKVKIVAPEDVATDPVLFTHEVPAVDNDYTIACGDENVLDLKLKWFEIEEPIIAKLNMSKTDFEANYKLDGTVTDASQFASNEDANAVALSADKKVGVIAQTTADVEGTMTQVLKWTVKNQQAWAAFKEGKKTLSTYVRYKKTGAKGKYDYFYVKFTWTPKKININPETTFGNGNKIKGYWYAENSGVAGSGYMDIHGNVEAVGTTNNTVTGSTTAEADDEYVFSIMTALEGNKLTVDKLAAPYDGLNANMAYKFAFVTGKGLFANQEGTKVYADQALTKEVATIDPVKGIVSYSKDETALQLLNAYDHSDLSKTVTAVVAVKASICGNIDVPVKKNTFNVKFLRPVDVKDAKATFTDAETNGSESDLSLTFVDWRDHNFTDNVKTKGHNYWKYYGVKSIKLDIANATSDLNGNMTQKLSEITSQVKFTFTEPTVAEIEAGKFGKIRYENNGLTVGEFHVNIPATITYDWGTIHLTVKCTVKKTQNNAKRH
ncbi:PL29 family lyase N-terminal domain-containing protein [Hoylesella timonensis]|uniref:PL29 family lyase N-terminal domain-containing protein n=1 Tax=Hoylesella timonensis TaxID=386414 RepID=UPI00336AD07E